MQRRRISVENILYELGNGRACGPVLVVLDDLLCGGDFASRKAPEEALWEPLVAALFLGGRAWHSGMVLLRKRNPSSGASRHVRDEKQSRRGYETEYRYQAQARPK